MRMHEEAVSPVIGTILMVAITVIIAAIIGAFTFGTAANIPKTRQLGFLHVVQYNSDIVIDYYGGPDSGYLEWFRIIAPDGTVYYSTATGVTTEESEKARPQPGASLVLSGKATGGRDRVIIVAHFDEGDEQVMYDAWL